MARMPRASSAGEGARPGSISHCTRTPLTSAWCSEPIARGGQDFLAPATAKKIQQRNRFFRMLPYLPPARSLVRYLSTRTATAIKLPEYP